VGHIRVPWPYRKQAALPLAFISDVFLSFIHAPHWLHDVASVGGT
jgi:hypothetical protein